ncbi:MAG: bifunctional glutamate N-acetyltransferase/amino-acid acetyltransferase ArgJ [Spirochaetales bacterium]|uniref:Arginine biosynthesis bifunctional protein ArgJ n=1 Tax=Candidatus Thalassospirochaeta sargassi TaxID=3119039 RepID=A0AAJ1IFA6_9SPIO|nr:bifunctional glutamate N-acetyltransferase/amino-acid acetyltransferase ArgJ [Spirochaetales bacterium]
MQKIKSATDYRNELESRGALPEGFSTGFTGLTFSPTELGSDQVMEMNLSMLMLDKPTTVFAGTFTKNLFPGAPVLLCRKRLENDRFRGIIINNKIANVCIETGVEDSEELLKAAAVQLGCSPDELMASSTGVIGWRLPVNEMINALPSAVESLRSNSRRNAVELAERIMTTDSFPKLRSRSVCGGRITAVAKGAGMIEPNMATMLCFIITDLSISRDELREMLPPIVGETFNRISVDSDQSTSDMVIAASSDRKPCADKAEFRKALYEVCSELAEDIVRNGEGTGHVIRVTVDGAASVEEASAIGKALVNSPLVKTAIAGNDPNVGRFASSIGDYCGNNGIKLPVDKMEISLGGELIFSGGGFCMTPAKEFRLAAYLSECGTIPEHKGWPVHEKTVNIDINIGMGNSRSTILGSDLTHEYVRENADYRT